MKFLYEYRTRDNVGHSGMIDAPDKDAAFAMLKAQGIRASRMTIAPGFFNNLFGRGKRWTAIAVLGVLCVVLTVLVLGRTSAPTESLAPFDDTTRRQVIGDAAVIEKGIRTGWADVFALEGDRFLASFAIPGVPAGQRSTTEDEIKKALDHSTANAEGIEARQIVAMVEGMKRELRAFLEKGGTISAYGRKLVQRQEQEIGYYTRAKREIDAAAASGMSQVELERLWERRNSALRAMGVKLVAMPE